MRQRIDELAAAIEQFNEILKQTPPANLSKAQMQNWEKQTQLLQAIKIKLADFQQKFTECLAKAKANQASNADEVFKKQAIKDFQSFSASSPAARTRLAGAQNASTMWP